MFLSAISSRVQQKNRILEKQLQKVTEEKENAEVTNPDARNDVAQNNNPLQDSKAEEPTFMFVKYEARQVKVNFDDKMLQSRCLYYVNMVNLCKKEGYACFTWDNGVIDDPNITYKIFFFDRKNGMKNLDPYVTGAMMKLKQ